MMDETDTQDISVMRAMMQGDGDDATTEKIIIGGSSSNGGGKGQSNIIIGAADDDETNPVCKSFPCDDCVVENRLWNLQTMHCYDDVFQYPQVVSASGNTATYRCCSALPQDGSVSRFVVTSPAYQATVWMQFTMSFIAAMMASLLIASIGHSVYQAAKKNLSHDANQLRNSIDYSAYNVYLIFLAIPGLAYNLFMLGIVTPDFFNGWIPENDALITISATTSQYMNVIIASEVLLLLRNLKNEQQSSPLSFRKAAMQFVGVTLYASILGVTWMYLLNYSSGKDGAQAMQGIPGEAFSISVFYLLVIILPGMYLIWACFEVWHKQLLVNDNDTIVEQQKHSSRDCSRSTARCTDEMSHPSSIKNLFQFSFRLQNDDFRDSTNGTNKSATSTNKSFSSKLARSNTTSNTTSTDGSVLTSMAKSLQENAMRDSMPPPASTSISSNGSLDTLATYFFRIILIFFILWLPGMVMYYKGYQTDRNASGILHNAGLVLFSLHSILSNAIAFTKPDVKKSTLGLFDDITNLCCRRSKEDGSDGSVPSGKYFPAEANERDIETPIDEEPSQSFSRDNSNASRVVGGIQMSQLTTHTVSSLNSSSHQPQDGDSECDVENSEYLEFATAGPIVARSSRVVVPGTSKHKRGIKIDNEEETKTKSTSGRRGSGILSASDPISKKKMSRRKSSSQSSHKSFDGNKVLRKNLKGKQSMNGSNRRRNSTNSVPPDIKLTMEKWEKSMSKDIESGKTQRRGSARVLEQKQSDGNIPKRGNGTTEDDASFSDLIGSSKQRKGSTSENVQKRRNSATGDSPVSELRKIFNGDDKSKGTSPGARPAHRRGSGSHLCKLNASNSPVAQMTLNQSPPARRLPRRSSNTKVDVSKSPVSQLRKKFTINDSDFSKSPIPSPPTKSNSTGVEISKRSPVAEMKKKFERGIDQFSAPKLEASKRRNSINNSANGKKSPSRRRLSNSDKNIGDAVDGTPKKNQTSRTFRGDSTSVKGRTRRVSHSKILSFDGRVTDSFLLDSV